MTNRIEQNETMQDDSIILSVLGKVRERRGKAHRREIGQIPTLDQVEIEHIARVLKETNGNVTHAAQVLGIDRRTLHRKLEQYAAELAAKG